MAVTEYVFFAYSRRQLLAKARKRMELELLQRNEDFDALYRRVPFNGNSSLKIVAPAFQKKFLSTGCQGGNERRIKRSYNVWERAGGEYDANEREPCHPLPTPCRGIT